MHAGSIINQAACVPGFTSTCLCCAVCSVYHTVAKACLTLLASLCRVKHKQEIGALRQELQKLQTDAKMGNKSKEMASKDLETTRKKLQDIEAKLKAALADKQTALQVSKAAHNRIALLLPD